MDLYQKFRAQEILNEIPSGNLIAAVSGGADSVCLLHLLKRLAKERQWAPVAVHIQHHLRGEASLKDQRFVEGLAGKWGLDFEARGIHPPEGKKTEEKSRVLRYAQLAAAASKRGSRAVLTAHNANDQAETFFLHILRGSGPDGLTGMPWSRPLSDLSGEPAHAGIHLIRPLLSFSRMEILHYLKSQGIAFRTDQSNRNLQYRRNWVRRKVIPLLEKAQPRLVERIASLARLLREQKLFMDAQVETMEKRVIRWGGSPPGSRLDLGIFFEYNDYLRHYFLHRLQPQDSLREIEAKLAFLKKRQKIPASLPFSGKSES